MDNSAAPPQEAGYLTIDDVAAVLQVSPRTVRKWASEGRLAHYRLGKRNGLRFTRRAIDAFVASREEAHA